MRCSGVGVSDEPGKFRAARYGGGGCGGDFAESALRMVTDVKAASDTILLATSPPCLIACEFNARLMKSRPPAGSPRIEDGFGVSEELLDALALVS